MSIEEFWRNVDSIVNKELFTKKNGKWIRNFEIYYRTYISNNQNKI